MKKNSTKIWLLIVLTLTLGAVAPAIAQTWTAKVLGTNLGVSAACKDAAGNVYVVETVATAQNQTQQNAQVVKFAAGTSTPTILTGTTFQYSEYESILNFSFGIGVDGSGNIFVTTYNDYFPSDGRDVTTYGNILKFTPVGGNAYTKSTWVTGQYPSGNTIGDFGALVIDSHNNIFVDAYNDLDGEYEIIEYPSGSTTPTVIYTHIGDAQLTSSDNYSPFTTLAIDPSDNLYAGTSFSTSGGADGGKLYKLTKASNYATVTQFGTNLYCTALACDASGALYGSIGVQSPSAPYTVTSPKIVKFSSDLSSTTPLYTGVSFGAYEPWGLVVPNAATIFAGAGSGVAGSDLGDLVQLSGAPVTPASNVTFSSITSTTATVGWTNGSGSSRAVFIKNTNTGQPVPVNATTYTASTTFASGTQIGATGWYCIFNGTGTSVNVTGLTLGQNYQVMAVEYNGAAGSENYLQTSGTNNPNTFITVSPTTINSLNTVGPATTNAGSVNFSAVFSSAVTGVTASNFSVTTTGVSGVSNANIGTPTTSDNITWTIPVSTGTGNGTIQLSLANATGMSKTISTSLPFAGQTYTIDKVRPTATIVVADNSLTAGETSLVTITFSEAVTGFTNADLTIANGTLSAVSSADGGVTWTATLTPAASTTDATNVITLDNTGVTDVAGNAGSGTTNSNNYAIDNVRPTATIVVADNSLTIGETSLVTITFSEAVTGFTNADLTVANGTLTAISTSDGGITWTATFTPTASIADATNVITLDNTGVTDAAGNTGSGTTNSNNYAIDTQAPTITVTPVTLPNATPPLSYGQTLSASGGTGPYTFSVTSGALPTGITLAANGNLSGTATQLGTFNFTITATDNSTGAGPYTGARAYTLTVVGPTLTLSPATLSTAATVGALYGQAFTTSRNIVTGGETYTYAVTAGALPAGVTLTSAGFLGGTPTEGGTFNFTITSTDNATGAGPYSGSQAYTLTVNAPTIIINPAPQVLATATPGVPYSQTQTGSGGTAPYTFTITAGNLPAGITMASDGSFSGTPTVLGTFNFTVTVTDASTGTGAPYTKLVARTITVNPPVITLVAPPLPALQVGVPYSFQFTAIGGTGPYTFAKQAGNLPAGLTLASDGTLSGTPTSVGSSSFAIHATDSSPSPGPYGGARNYFGVAISAPTIAVGPATIPDGTAGVAYSQNVTATGGTAPYTYAVTTGALPAGVTLASDGTLSGTSNVTGTFNFTVTAADATTGTGAPYTGSTAYTLTFVAPTITLAPTTLPAATVATAYSQSVTASGGTAPYTYAVTAGALPAGLTLSSTGAITGTPSAGGNFNFTVTATDALTFTGSRAYLLTINAPTIAVTPVTLPNATPPLSYGQTLSASGGTGPYTFSVTSGALPTGITLAANGNLSGTATQLGTFNFTITATDNSTGAGPYTGARAYVLTVVGPTLTLSPATLSTAATVGALYGQAFTTSRNISTGGETYTYAVTAGALPAGVTLTSAGFLGGTPTEGGTFNFTITSTDNATGAGPYSGSQAYTLTVNAPTIIIQPLPLLSPSPVAAYNQTLTSFNGTAPYSYAITAGALPPGITLSSGGILTGTATALGTFNFSITSTDSSTGTGPFTKTQSYTFTVSGPIPTVVAATLPPLKVGVPYSFTFTATGINTTAPYTFAPGAGTIPPGLTLAADGTLSGTPTKAGSFLFFVKPTDGSPSPGPYPGAQRSFSGTISAPTIVVGPANLPDGTAGVAYSQNITATGGTAPYTYAVTTGALPAGVTLDSDGTLSGTSNVTGTFNFTVTAADATTGTGAPYTGSTAYTLTFVAPTITLAPTTLPAATAGTAYSQTINASGGTGPYTYAVTTGALPAGLTLSAATGTISGTVTATGTFNFTVTGTDGNSFTGSQAYTQTINAPTIVLAPSTLPAATVATAYSQSVTASGGTAPYTYAVTAGALPTGLSLSATTGTITGTPTAGGSFNFTVTAIDALTFTGVTVYPLTVNAPTIVLTPATLPAGAVGLAYSQSITASGGTGPYTYALTAGTLPTGLTLAVNGTISGTPTAGGTYNFTVTATDASSGTGPYTGLNAYSITIGKVNQTITFADITATYGDAPVALSATSSSGLPVAYTSSNTAVATVSGNTLTILAAGTATITASQAGNSNYNAAADVPKTLTVNRKAIAIIAATQTKVYGTADPALIYQVTSGTLAGTDVFTGSLTRDAGEAVNTYAIKQGTLTLGNNYTLTYTGADLTITKAALTATANDQTRAYGAADPAFTVSYVGFVNGDSEASLTTGPTISTTATISSAAGTYPLTIAGAVSPNYTIAYVAGTLTITKPVLTVTADNKSRNYGAPNPQFTVTYSGFLNGDDASKLTTAPVATSNSTAATVPGNYPIAVSGGASADYTFNYVPGTLTIVPLTYADLISLTTSSGSLSPQFDAGTFTYNVTVDNAIADLKLTAIFDATASATVNDMVMPNGGPSFGVPLSVGNNLLTLTVTAQDGITKKTYSINVYRGIAPTSITSNNILTPNGDGKNDIWVVKDIQLYPNNHVTVYDSGGRAVFNKRGYNNDWGGTLNETGVPLAGGTYFYTVDLGIGQNVIKGYISIIRSN